MSIVICNSCFWFGDCGDCGDCSKIKKMKYKDDTKIDDICPHYEMNDVLSTLIEDDVEAYVGEVDRGQFKKDYDNYLEAFYKEV